MKSNQTEPQNEQTFEEALAELDGVVRALESGNVPLEQLLALSQRGNALAEFCDARLAAAESVLEQLTLSSDGELQTTRLQWVDDDDTDGDA